MSDDSIRRHRRPAARGFRWAARRLCGGLSAAVVLGVLLAGCGASAPPASPAGSASADASAGPGWTIVDVPDGPDAPHLRITAAALMLTGGGTASLSVRITNAGAVEDHLAAVRLPAADAVGRMMTTAPAQTGAGEGIPVPAAATAAIGPDQPWRVTFPATGGLKAGQTTRVLLDFTVAGEVAVSTPVRTAP